MEKTMKMIWLERLEKMDNTGNLTDSPNIIAKLLGKLVKKEICIIGGKYRFVDETLNTGNKIKLDKKVRDILKEFLTGGFLRYISENEAGITKSNSSYTGDYYINQIKNKMRNNKRWVNNIVMEMRDTF